MSQKIQVLGSELRGCGTLVSVEFNSFLHKRQPTRLLRPWDSPGKNTGVVAISSSIIALHRLLIAVASSVAEHRLQGTELQ